MILLQLPICTTWPGQAWKLHCAELGPLSALLVPLTENGGQTKGKVGEGEGAKVGEVGACVGRGVGLLGRYEGN